jgi:hypothetical protein
MILNTFIKDKKARAIAFEFEFSLFFKLYCNAELQYSNSFIVATICRNRDQI